MKLRGEEVLVDVLLEALERHIQQALADQQLPPLAREKFGERLRDVQAKREKLRETMP